MSMKRRDQPKILECVISVGHQQVGDKLCQVIGVANVIGYVVVN